MMYESPFWLTFRQVSQLGGSVRKGEKACPVVFWKQTTTEDKESSEQKKKYLLRFVAQMPQPPILKHGMTHAYYSPREDCVGLPPRERFERTEDYYSTVFHELVHSTGHEKRLKRSTLAEKSGFGSNPYCKEELIAEMGAAFLCGLAEIGERTIDNSAAYLNGWLDQLRQDKMLIVQAAAQAQKAADFILGRTFAESEAAHD
jgi:antirestriction protein ArdC